jgi:hypothetical protein
MLFLLILASAHLALVVVVRVAPFATDGDRTTRIAYGIGGSGGIGPRFGLCFIEFCISVRCFGEFECLLRILEFAVMTVLGRHSQDGLNHIPMQRNMSFGLHDTAHCDRQLGLDSGGGRVERIGHVERAGNASDLRSSGAAAEFFLNGSQSRISFCRPRFFTKHIPVPGAGVPLAAI